MSISDLTYEQWLTALEEAKAKADSVTEAGDSYSMVEWRRILGWAENRTEEYIRQGVNQGWMEMTWQRRTNISGVSQLRPTYRMVRKEEAPPAPRRRGKKK